MASRYVQLVTNYDLKASHHILITFVSLTNEIFSYFLDYFHFVFDQCLV